MTSDRLLAICLLGTGLWSLLLGHLGLGLAATLFGATWLWGRAEEHR